MHNVLAAALGNKNKGENEVRADEVRPNQAILFYAARGLEMDVWKAKNVYELIDIRSILANTTMLLVHGGSCGNVMLMESSQRPRHFGFFEGFKVNRK